MAPLEDSFRINRDADLTELERDQIAGGNAIPGARAAAGTIGASVASGAAGRLAVSCTRWHEARGTDRPIHPRLSSGKIRCGCSSSSPIEACSSVTASVRDLRLVTV